MVKQLLAALTLLTVLSPAYATLTFTLTQEGPDVVARVNGSVNTTAIPPVGSPANCNGPAGVGGVQPSTGTLCVAGSPAQPHPGIVGPTSFGPGGTTVADFGAGDIAYVQGITGTLFLPSGYVSGTGLSGISRFSGTSLALMGVSLGTFTYTFGTGPTADTVVVVISDSGNAVPTLGEYGLLALATLLVLSATIRLRKAPSGRP